jgi:sodium/proline symporter
VDSAILIGSFVVCLILFTAVGAWSARHKVDTTEDYLLASRSVNPWLTALSAVSTNNSGYMFIGLIGFTWRQGLEAVWITFGWVLGDYLTWHWVHRRVRMRSERVGALSVPALLATDNNGRVGRAIAGVAGLLTVFFLGGYAAAQLKAGATSLEVLFGWPLWIGCIIGIVVVVIYCFAGGIRASIWTDAVQSGVMLVAMAMLLGAAITQVGGWSALVSALHAIDPQLVEWVPRDLTFGLGLYAIGFVAAGVGTVGQPHILIRFMAIDSAKSLPKARRIYVVWYTVFSAAAMAVGLYARVLLPDLTASLTGTAAVTATESALPLMAIALLPPIAIGLMLAGIFSATLSTADSQILACSAAVTQDILPRLKGSYLASKVATLGVAGVALTIALTADAGVFSLVLVAWAALAASLGPVLLVRLSGASLPQPLAVAMMVLGLAVVFTWGADATLADAIYKAFPGMLAPLALYGVARLVAPSWVRATPP